MFDDGRRQDVAFRSRRDFFRWYVSGPVGIAGGDAVAVRRHFGVVLDGDAGGSVRACGAWRCA